MNTKQIISVIVALIVVIVIIAVIAGGVEKNNSQNWQHVQGFKGGIRIKDKAGWYAKWYATVTTYPRFAEAAYNDQPSEGRKARESVRATFNDGGTAQIDTYVKYSTPTSEINRKEFHQQFSGNIENLRTSIKAHLNQCIKAASPLMSASENQSARKAEYAQVIESMLRDGLYKMKKVERVLKGRFDSEGKPITVVATEILYNEDGSPVVERPSPLMGYNVNILQFSVTGIEYDPETKKQFAAKKQSYLQAEKAKAERERQRQEKLMVTERKLAELAEITGEANKEKMKAVVAAEQKAEVALQVKIEQETKANMALAVAKIRKQEAETEANQRLEVARINLLAAGKDAERIIKLAKAEEKRIQLAGAITEKDRILAGIQAKRDVDVSVNLSKIQSPAVVFAGGSGGGDDGVSVSVGDMGDRIMKMLINMRLLAGAGLLPTDFNRTKAISSITKN